jgi:hypothetical protein
MTAACLAFARHQDVVGFQVAVDKSSGVGRGHPIRNLNRDVQ